MAKAKTQVEVKRELAEKISPHIKSLIKKYGYESVAYTWTKTVEKQRQIAKVKVQIENLKSKATALERSLVE